MLSSLGADQPTGTGPIKGLHYLENALRGTGTILTALRAGSFQENVALSLAPAKTKGIFPSFTPSADYPLPMIATKDIGALAAELLLNPPAKSDVVDQIGPAYSNRQVAEKLGAALGKKLDVIDIPQAGWVDALKQGGIPQSLAELFAEMYGAAASGKLAPKGDRLVHGETTLDEVLRTLV
jgi:uncharacterized protein YbjT (DUF2867 family)